ncbi:hypothetical protein [Desertibaculum subflavum]
MRYLRDWLDLLRDPLATANREALGFALLFYGGGTLAFGLVGLVAWLVLA